MSFLLKLVLPFLAAPLLATALPFAERTSQSESFCGELKSLELRTSDSGSWGIAQMYNEVAKVSPIVLVTDFWTVQLLLTYLPNTQVRVTGGDHRTYWNSTMEAGKYLLCIKADRGEDESWGGRFIPSYDRVYELKLVHKGRTIFMYGGKPSLADL